MAEATPRRRRSARPAAEKAGAEITPRPGEMDAGEPHPFSKDEYESLARFRYGLRRFLRFSEIATRRANLRPQHYQLLLAIKGYPGRDWVTVGEAAERLQIQHNSAVGLADRCERLGLIRREDHPSDRRVIVLRLTDKGEEILSGLVHLHRDELQRLRDLLRIPS